MSPGRIFVNTVYLTMLRFPFSFMSYIRHNIRCQVSSTGNSKYILSVAELCFFGGEFSKSVTCVCVGISSLPGYMSYCCCCFFFPWWSKSNLSIIVLSCENGLDKWLVENGILACFFQVSEPWNFLLFQVWLQVFPDSFSV